MCHHAFPNALGTLSQRGRFHGWKKVHDASVCCLPVGSLQVSVFVGCLFVDHCILTLLGPLNSKTNLNEQCLEKKTFSTHDFHAYIALGLNHDWSKHGEIAPSFAKVEVLYRGLWKPNGDEETEMQKQQKKRSLLMRQGQWRPRQCQFPTWVQWKNKKQPGRESARGRMNRMRTWSRWKKHSENSCCFWTPIGLHIISHFCSWETTAARAPVLSQTDTLALSSCQGASLYSRVTEMRSSWNSETKSTCENPAVGAATSRPLGDMFPAQELGYWINYTPGN